MSKPVIVDEYNAKSQKIRTAETEQRGWERGLDDAIKLIEGLPASKDDWTDPACEACVCSDIVKILSDIRGAR